VKWDTLMIETCCILSASGEHRAHFGVLSHRLCWWLVALQRAQEWIPDGAAGCAS
jgi:hypothetical protein